MRCLLAIILVLLLGQNAFAVSDTPPAIPIFTIESGFHNGQISKIAVDEASRYLVSASIDKTIRVWTLPELKALKTLRPPIGDEYEGKLNAIAISKDGTIIAAGGNTGSQWDGSYCVYIFGRENGQLLHRIVKLPAPIMHLTFSRDGKYLGVALKNKGVRLYETSNWTIVGSDSEYPEQADWLDFDQNGRMVSISDGVVQLYYTQNDGIQRLKLLSSKPAPGGGLPASVSFNPDSNMLALGYDSPYRVDIISATDLSLLATPYLAGNGKDFLELQSVAWSQDGKNLYAGGRRGKDGKKVIVRWPVDRGSLPKTTDLRSKKQNSSNYYLIPTPFYNRIQQILPLSSGRIVFATADPGIGILDDDNQLIGSVNPVISEFNKTADSFFMSEKGDVIQFGYRKFGTTKASFSFQHRRFLQSDELEEIAVRPPLTDASLNITNWYNKPDPMLKGVPLEVQGKYSRSLAIAPDKKSFLLGVDKQIYRFDNLGKVIWRKNLPGTAFGLNISSNGNMFAAAVSDGTIRWYTMETASEIVALFSIPDKKLWIVWSPEGYFDASPGSEELIGFHLNNGINQSAEFISMNNLYDVFYRPDIIQAKIRGEDITSLITITVDEAMKNPPPIVTFTKVPAVSDSSIEKVCYKANSCGGGIGEVRLFQNGKLIKSDGFYREIATNKETAPKIQLANINSRAIQQEQRGLAVQDKKVSNSAVAKSKGDVFDECFDIETIAGENEISLVAFNAPNTVQSSMKTVTFNSTRTLDVPHLYILSVGIDNYHDASVNLKYAAKDATDFITKLSEKSQSIYDPKNIHMITLVNHQASKQGIMKAIEDLAAKVKHGDGFILFNASHGVLLQNQYYIITADFNGDLDNTNTLISSNEIIEISKRIKSLSQLIIFDTCHAGGVDNIVSGLYDARMSVMAKKMGLHIYASAGSIQTAIDGYKGNGLYTHTLLQGIENGKAVDREKNGKVTVKKLGHYTKEMTTEISTKLGHPQTPFIINFGRDNPLFEVK